MFVNEVLSIVEGIKDIKSLQDVMHNIAVLDGIKPCAGVIIRTRYKQRIILLLLFFKYFFIYCIKFIFPSILFRSDACVGHFKATLRSETCISCREHRRRTLNRESLQRKRKEYEKTKKKKLKRAKRKEH